jgi:hypothetical protein
LIVGFLKILIKNKYSQQIVVKIPARKQSNGSDLFLAKSWTDSHDEANSTLSHNKAPKRGIKYRNTRLLFDLIKFFSEIFVFK